MSAAQIAPDFLVVMENIAKTLPSIYSVLSFLFMLLALTMVFSGVMDLAQSTEKKRKYLGTHQASGWSGVVKIILGGVMAQFAASGQAIEILTSIFYGSSNSFSLISIDSYIASPDENEIQKMVKIVLIGIGQIVGLLAIFKGIRIWGKASDRSGKEGFWHGVNYVIFGVLCVQSVRVMGTIQNTLGYDFLSMVGLM